MKGNNLLDAGRPTAENEAGAESRGEGQSPEKRHGAGQVITGFTHHSRGVVLVIGAYFDYSEKNHKGRGFASIGGYAALAPEWDAFVQRWNEVIIRPNGIRAFHMADCEGGFGEFCDPVKWPKERRHALIKTAVGIVPDYVRYGLVKSVVFEDVPTIQEIARQQVGPQQAGPHDLLSFFETAYSLLVPEIFAELQDELDRVPGFAGQPVELVFDRETKAAHVLIQAMDDHIDRHGLRARFREYVVADRYCRPPIQASDIVAYEATKYLYNTAHDSGRSVRKSYRRLQSLGKINFGVWSVKYPESTNPAVDEPNRGGP